MHHSNSWSSRREVAIGVGLVAVGGVVGMLVGYFWGKKQARINQKQRLQTDKVVDTIDMEDIGEKKAFCRCWHSNKFPYCDGTHVAHNKATGDNVGPLIVKGSGSKQ